MATPDPEEAPGVTQTLVVIVQSVALKLSCERARSQKYVELYSSWPSQIHLRPSSSCQPVQDNMDVMIKHQPVTK